MFLEHLQGQWLYHFPGQPIPAPDDSFREFESPLALLETILSSPIAGQMGGEANPHLATTSLQAVVESDKVFPEPSLLWAKSSPFFQQLLNKTCAPDPSLASLPFSLSPSGS